MKNYSASQTKQMEETREQSAASAAGIDSISKGIVMTMGGVSAAIGIWAISCLISAASVAGPLGLIKGFITAVTGV